MLFLWDIHKANSNLKKHGVSFELAQTVFDDPYHLSIIDDDIEHEERFITLGRSIRDHVLLVVHTYLVVEDGHERIRLISARRATRKEVLQYEKGI